MYVFVAVLCFSVAYLLTLLCYLVGVIVKGNQADRLISTFNFVAAIFAIISICLVLRSMMIPERRKYLENIIWRLHPNLVMTENLIECEATKSWLNKFSHSPNIKDYNVLRLKKLDSGVSERRFVGSQHFCGTLPGTLLQPEQLPVYHRR